MKRIPISQTRLPSIDRPQLQTKKSRYTSNPNSMHNSRTNQKIKGNERKALQAQNRFSGATPLIMDRADNGLYMSPYRSVQSSLET